MLANFSVATTQSGALSRDVHLPAAFKGELLEFIANNLPRWRDDPERPKNTSETALTEHLCDYLTGSARLSPGWDILQFRTEIVDEQHKGRKIDLAPKPCGIALWIEGRRHTQYDSLIPIECKRLPTPKTRDRDEREYVIHRSGSTGGIQRFKSGYHGSLHAIAAMIGYVQEETPMFWHNRITGWIGELAESAQPGWTQKDMPEALIHDKILRVSKFRSFHDRENGQTAIELRHFWLEMN